MPQEKMRAKAARRKYFEHYVMFEYMTRRLCNRMFPKFQTGGISLKRVIQKIADSARVDNRFASSLFKQKNSRNWLAHKPWNKVVPDKGLNDFIKIKKFNKTISGMFIVKK